MQGFIVSRFHGFSFEFQMWALGLILGPTLELGSFERLFGFLLRPIRSDILVGLNR